MSNGHDKHTLIWGAYKPPPTPLPDHIQRFFIPTPRGHLELLIAMPRKHQIQRKQALFFQHGGFGSASVWVPYLTYFSQIHGFSCYALSLRGHGTSWQPSYLELVFRMGKKSMSEDLGAALLWVRGFEAGQRLQRDVVDRDAEIVLIGHSAGGGLSQYFLSQELGTAHGLVMAAPFPSFGGWGVYWNWFKLDPMFLFRFLRDFGHPRSPLSSTSLVHRAFFSPEYPAESVKEFEKLMSERESLLWPSGMMFPFVNLRKVLQNILGWGSRAGQQRIMVVAGGQDKLMSPSLMLRTAVGYVRAYRAWVGVEAKLSGHTLSGNSVLTTVDGVRFVIVNGAGHHLQNDLQWEEGAKQILDFVEQL